MEEKIEKEKSMINSVEQDERVKFGIEFFDKHENKTTQLINNTEIALFQKGSKRRFTLYFKEPVFVESVFIDVEDYSPKDHFDFEFLSVHENSEFKTRMARDAEEKKFSVSVHRVIRSFSFRPPSKYWANPKIKAIRVYGLTWEQFDKISENLFKVERHRDNALELIEEEMAKSQTLKNEALEFADKKQDILAEIEEKNADKVKLDAVIAELLKTKAEYEATIQGIRKTETDVTNRISILDVEVQDKKAEVADLNEKFLEQQKNLKRLKDDINMFPANFRGFVEQGGENIKRYAKFSIIPIALILALTGFLFWGTADLSARYEKMPKMDLYTMLGSRLPFAMLAIAIIVACYKLAKFLIEEIMKITRQRLTLTQISIIATDVSDVSMRDIEFSDEEQFELRTKLKMSLLKSYLKQIVEDDYEYEIELTLWERFLKKKKMNKLSAKVDAQKKTATINIGEEAE